MKKIKYIAFSCILALGLASCNDWLDVNTDPDSPNNESITVKNRLPWIQKFYMYSAGVTNYRTAATAGVYYSTNGNVNTAAVTWNMANGLTTTSYQTFFVECASNLNDLYSKAEKEGAYHYMACADVVHAMGFMQMLDLYGEMPYSQALVGNPSPAYDDGKAIFNGCIAKLDEAIELFSKTQEAGATPLSSGDMWNGGDASKWIKMCYGLKARYLLKLSKKSDLFNPDEILSCLEKAAQSNGDNTVSKCYNSETDVTDYLLGDPIMTNGNWDCVSYGATQRISKYHYDLLTNMRGAGVVDPRMPKIVPAAMSNIKLGDDGKVRSYDWNRSTGVDVYGDAAVLLAGGATSIIAPTFVNADTKVAYTIADATAREEFVKGIKHAYTVEDTKVTVTYPKGSLFVNSTNYLRAGDTTYVSLRSNSYLTGQAANNNVLDVNWYVNAAASTAGVVGSTGSYQTRPVSDFELVTYPEMCFIKAEVYMRKGNTGAALTAYQDGIKARMDMMQGKLTEWKAAGYNNPDMYPMDESDITAYLASAAVCHSAGELTMSDIMLQKYIAMGCSIENWNDMRRFNYSAGNIEGFGVVYPGYGRSPLFSGQAKITGSTPSDPTYWVRRWRLPDKLELSYNGNNALAVNKYATDQTIWCRPVWWDCATDSEYYGYIQ